MQNTHGIAFDDLALLYKAGEFDSIHALLSATAIEDLEKDPRLLGLLANASLKIGNKLTAADAFVAFAKFAGAQRDFLMRSAAQLYVEIKSAARLEEIVVEVVEKQPLDYAFTRRALDVVKNSPVIEKLIPFLDQNNPEHAFFKLNFYKSIKDMERSYEAVLEGVRQNPDDLALAIEYYSQARPMCDFDAMRRFEKVVTDPQNERDRNIFRYQLALDRLNWCDDEHLQGEPTQDSRNFLPTQATRSAPGYRREISSGGKLKIGYITDEFTSHVVLNVFKHVLFAHDRERFDVQLFCYTPEKDKKIQDAWPDYVKRELIPIRHLSNEEAVQVISRAGTDILIDLKGHTAGARLQIMNMTDAPLTATYLGFPSTVSGTSIDYLISDLTVTPDSSKPHYREKLCRLPEVQMPNPRFDREDIIATTRSAHGLPEDKLVFGSFNALRKMTTRLMGLWIDILHAAPNSVLWILCLSPTAKANLKLEFSRNGISEDRILFIENKLDFPEHLGRLGLADLALDTLPYNGHSTTADILRAGVPVVTTRGNSYHSRVSFTILKSFGLEQLAVENDRDYVELAVALANDKRRLETIRNQIKQRQNLTPLFQPERMARHLEAAYLLMAERARHGLQPDHIDVPALQNT